MTESRVLEERDAFAILEEDAGRYILSNFESISIGRPTTLLLKTGEIIQTSSVLEWKSYPSNQVITKNSIYYIECIYR